jgi:hypothetical protein
MSRAPSLALALALAVALLAGCLGKAPTTEVRSAAQQQADSLLGKEGQDKLADAATPASKAFLFPLQQLLPPANVTLKATVGPDSMGGYEAENDEGGIDYNTKVTMYDLAKYVPVGQAAEITVKLYWDASEANSADIDIVSDVPGNHTSYSGESETLNWNYAVKEMVLDTVGVQGEDMKVGVQVASAIVSKGFEYRLDVGFVYPKDVLTPYHAWGLVVPQGANGIVFSSEKAGGDDHVTSQFLLLGPDDQPVAMVDYNDISIPTQSIFVPVKGPGEYVFYAHSMHGGFLRAKADVPVQDAVARELALVTKTVADAASPTPGVAGHDYMNGSAAGGVMPHDDAGGSTITFAPEGPFPLEVTPYVKGQVTTMAKIRLSSPLGVVAERTVIGRYQDDRGTLGYTSDHEQTEDDWHDWSKLARGTWKAEVVDDAPSVEIGHVVLTYQR